MTTAASAAFMRRRPGFRVATALEVGVAIVLETVTPF
jgi:hypothetical protein